METRKNGAIGEIKPTRLADLDEVIAVIDNATDRLKREYGYLSGAMPILESMRNQILGLKREEDIPVSHMENTIKYGRKWKGRDVENALRILDASVSDWKTKKELKNTRERWSGDIETGKPV